MTKNQAVPFNLASLDLSKSSETPFEFELKHPHTGFGIGAFVSVIGDNSSAVTEFSKRFFREKMSREEMAKKKGRPFDVDNEFDFMEKFAIDGTAVRVVGWRNLALNDGGAETPYTPQNCIDALTIYSWVREQVLEVSKDLGNFIKA